MALACVVEAGDLRIRERLRAEGAEAVWASVRASTTDDAWSRRAALVDLASVESLARRHGLRFVVPSDPEWPSALADLDGSEPVQQWGGAPLGLWVKGSASLAELAADAVAVVGCRASTAYGERVATELAAGLAEGGTTVVSGGAFGIDAAAHRGALAADGPTLPKTRYRTLRMSADKKVFFDVVKTPADNTCYYCHTARFASTDAAGDWTHDEDVHLRAGMTCSDCHRNGIEHDTVRGFEGEQHSTSASVATLSCRGCHLDDKDEVARVVGGRLGAPKPLHRGLPTIHLELLSCTACHSGPQLDRDKQVFRVQTAMAHGLGLPTHSLNADSEPGIVAPVILKSDGVLYPHRTVWPAFWGEMQGTDVKPLSPQAVYDTLRTTLRVRGNSTFTETLGKVTLKAEDKAAVLGEERAKVAPAELTADERDKLAQLEKTKSAETFREKLSAPLKKLKTLIQTPDAQPVYVSGGRVYRLGQDGETVEVLAEQVAAAQPYSWKLAHDVRPARWSTGASGGCYECHSLGSPFFDSQVTAVGPAPDVEPPSERMAELAGLDRLRIDTWNLSFQGRAAFKWFGFASAGIVGLVLLSFVFLGINGLGGFARRS